MYDKATKGKAKDLLVKLNRDISRGIYDVSVIVLFLKLVIDLTKFPRRMAEVAEEVLELKCPGESELKTCKRRFNDAVTKERESIYAEEDQLQGRMPTETLWNIMDRRHSELGQFKNIFELLCATKSLSALLVKCRLLSQDTEKGTVDTRSVQKKVGYIIRLVVNS